MAAASSVARRYAAAYFDLAKEAGDIAAWRDELAAVAEALSADEVAEAVINPKLPLAERTRLGLQLLDGVAEPARNLARLLIERRRSALLREILTHYDSLADQEAGVVRA
ncbi:MAG: F0F1 ATP synthase subunit delta, partial [Candidatus Dormibacteraeota bacterium]|nr:F0F1 ATP synthase subunit delta [Candidatus Dormibacteraeota bacterium]